MASENGGDRPSFEDLIQQAIEVSQANFREAEAKKSIRNRNLPEAGDEDSRGKIERDSIAELRFLLEARQKRLADLGLSPTTRVSNRAISRKANNSSSPPGTPQRPRL